MTDIMLDPQIRDWVLLPLTLIMVFLGVGRHYAMKLMQTQRNAEKDTVRSQQRLGRSSMLRGNCVYLPRSAFYGRKAYYNDGNGNGLYVELGKQKMDPSANPMMSDPSMMMDMMKGNMAMIIPNVLMMPAVSYFFSGFLTAKIPFALTPKFKEMLQRGVEVTSLDVSFVSSLSWYFMLFMGLRGVFMLILGDNNQTDEARLMQQSMTGGAGAGRPGQPQDWGKIFTAEMENLELTAHTWVVDEAEGRLLSRDPTSVVD